jgi:hypothetical protein
VLAAGVMAQEASPPADQLMAEVRARLPQDKLTITGYLDLRLRKGIVVKSKNVSITLDLGAAVPTAAYTILDKLGKPLERMTVTRPFGKHPTFAYEAGDPLKATPKRNLFAPIQATDISWIDLTLSFLWWQGGRVVGEDTAKGEDCFVVEVPAPKGKKELYDKVKVWIHKQQKMILKAEGYGAGGRLVRRLWIRSFRKIEGRWMVKDLEVQSTFPAVRRTRLRVQDMDAKKADEQPDVDD